MAYCPKCGAKLLDDALYCQECGHKLSQETGDAIDVEPVHVTPQRNEPTALQLVAEILMVITTVVTGFALIPLCWMIPMTVHYFNCVKQHRKAGLAFGVCTILFANTIAGILMLVDEAQ